MITGSRGRIIADPDQVIASRALVPPDMLHKPPLYYETPRSDMVPRLPAPLGAVLDVGCGAGATGPLLRARGASSLTGIEPNRTAARAAAEVYDDVREGSAEDVLPTLTGPFDTILCYDVLEHLVDPWAVLDQIARVSPPRGRLHVSVPNARHLSLALDLAFRGTFGYTDGGHRDNTHLRWFAPADIERAVEDAGFSVCSRSHPALSLPRRALGRLTRGRSTAFLVIQWQLLAVRRSVPAPAE